MSYSRFVYSKSELEELADSINRRFFSNRLIGVSPLDPYDLVEKIGCDVEWKYISPDESILGMTFFDDGMWYIWENGECVPGVLPQKEYFKKGTVVINQMVLDKQKTEKENWVVTHEASHWIKDQKFFKFQEDTPCKICAKNDFEGTYWDNNMPTLKLIEAQTNYLAAAILMPREATKERFFKLCRYKNIPQRPIEYKSFMKAQIATLAKEYNLNFNPVLYRLNDIEVFERKNNWRCGYI